MSKRWKRRSCNAAKLAVVCASALCVAVSVCGVRDESVARDELLDISENWSSVTDAPAEVKTTGCETEEVPESLVDSISVLSGTTLPEYSFGAVNLSEEQMDGFVTFDIPQAYAMYGGKLPVSVQQYAWCVCKSYGYDYPTVIAVIEKESGYRYDAVGSAGEQGYMQILQRWHEGRMERLNCTDLMDPYMNILVAVDYLDELVEQYQDEHLALSIYNRGFRNDSQTGALDLWDNGAMSTEYSRSVIQRADEIRLEILADA